MLHFRPCAVAILFTATVVAAARVARAETCTLELKRLEAQPRGVGIGRAWLENEWLYRSTSSQGFFTQLGEKASRPPGADAEFRKIVKKEPEKYVSKEPFRGVARLGSGEFAFVLDAKDEKSKGYDRLYFDLNANGDLTDDKPLDALSTPSPGVVGPENYAQHRFPRADLTIPVEGKPQAYSFLFSVSSYGTKDYRYASASLSPAAYRAGEITLDGQKRKVALLDYNANGRFDDECKIPGNIFYSGGGIYAQMGDVLLIDPDKAASSSGRADGYGTEYRQYVSKLASIGGKFFNVKLSPSGDQLTLTPSPLKIGHFTNPQGPFTGMIYGDHGFLAIRGEAGKPVTVPEGQWKLLSYSIEIAGWKPPPEPEKKAGEEKEKPKGLLDSLARALLGAAPPAERPQPRYGPAGVCSVQAQGTARCKPVTVVAGETVAFPFGPPYKPVVEASVARWVGGGEAQLSMSLVGSAGEVVSDLVVDGYRPPKPEFTISDRKGEVVQKGSFEYG